MSKTSENVNAVLRLIAEMESRPLLKNTTDKDLYYALCDDVLEKVIEFINPLLDEKIGRTL